MQKAMNNSSSSGQMKLIVLGASGMLGSKLFQLLRKEKPFITYGTIRGSRKALRPMFYDDENIIEGVDVLSEEKLKRLFDIVKPDIVINCVGFIKQLLTPLTTLECIELNAAFPHRLAKLTAQFDAKLIHFSTDCVFSGKKGNYKEVDIADARDVYGITKYLGELHDDNTLTLRTSIIGHEISSSNSLVDWFLSQRGEIKGYRNAIFSGLPTTEVARVLIEYIIPKNDLNGLYHLSVDPINKFDLLQLVAKQYAKEININPSDEVSVDRSLNSSKFKLATNYSHDRWPELIEQMHAEYLSNI